MFASRDSSLLTHDTIDSFTVIFTCRFILDLHEAAAISSVAVTAVTRPQALPVQGSTRTQFSGQDSGPTLSVAKYPWGSRPRLDVSFGSMSIFGAMIPYIGERSGGGVGLGDADGDREKETFLGHRADFEAC